MNRKWKVGSVVLLGLVVVGGLVIMGGLMSAQEKATKKAEPGSPAKQDEAAIRQASQAFVRAFEKGNGKEVAAFWTEQGEYIDEDGEPVHGHAALEKAYASFFAKRSEIKAESTVDDVRMLGLDTAIEEGTFTVRSQGAATESSKYSALYVREKGKWLMALLKEWGDTSTHGARLEDLAWLIGTWETEGAEQQARTTYEWTDNKKFIRCRFTIAGKKDEALVDTGTQVIGVDAAAGRIRAWIFDGEGGFGDSFWSWDEDRWAIESSATLGDGSETTAVNFLKPTGPDSFEWRSTHRMLDGQHLPDVGPVKVKKVAEKK